MNYRLCISRVLLTFAAAATFAVSAVAGAQPKTAATTNAPIETEIPKSIFQDKLPSGKDPFFPRSRRIIESSSKTNTAPVSASALVYRGTSGTVGKPLAIINTQTFAEGDVGDVVTPIGKIWIRVDRIRPDSVTILVGNPPQPMTLHLQTGFQFERR